MTVHPAIAERREQLEAIAAQANGTKGRKSRSLLGSPAPPPGADRDEIAAWLTDALALGADPVAGAEQYGRHEDARLVLLLRSGQRITFERAQDTFDPARLVRVVMIATGAQIAPYGRGDVLHIAGSVIRLAALLAEDDERGEAVEWGRAFLTGAARNLHTVADFANAVGRYEALSVLSGWKAPSDLAPYAPACERSALILDQRTGTRLARTSDFAAHVRGTIGRGISWSAMHGRMVEVGWQHLGQVEQRQPKGHGRLKAHLYAIGAGWESE